MVKKNLKSKKGENEEDEGKAKEEEEGVCVGRGKRASNCRTGGETRFRRKPA